MHNYKVSILVPVYGVEKYIERCAVSLFEQTYENIEFIFVNDCTKDNSIEILKSAIFRYPNRKNSVQIINHLQNKGLGGARNTAVAAAKGDFILHVDSDDYIENTCIEKCVCKQIETGADIISVESADDYNGKITPHALNDYSTKEEFLIALIKHYIRNNIWGRLIRRSLYIDNNIRVEQNVSMSEDLQVIPRLVYFSNNIAFVHEPLYFYECSNINSYTYSFSEKKGDQRLQTMALLNSFFKERAPKYLDAIEFRLYQALYDLYINSAKNKVHKDYNQKVKVMMKPYTKKYLRTIPIAKRIAWYLNNYFLLHLYLKCVFIIKRGK